MTLFPVNFLVKLLPCLSKMSYFSGKVLLGDLDDFIAPAQACSTGLFSNTPQGPGKTQLVMEDDLDEEFG